MEQQGSADDPDDAAGERSDRWWTPMRRPPEGPEDDPWTSVYGTLYARMLVTFGAIIVLGFLPAMGLVVTVGSCVFLATVGWPTVQEDWLLVAFGVLLFVLGQDLLWLDLFLD
ncbi:hypothetical protein BRD17_00715 [Halobacteriales archaeon SW_7_68_16]|nr:MAG: hypothetical protein BRD17_00715 [Halobacteriales archaeon SW_7_68_16]